MFSATVKGYYNYRYLYILKYLKNLKILLSQKKTPLTALGFEARSLDCRLTAITTKPERHPASPPQEDLLILSSGSALRL